MELITGLPGLPSLTCPEGFSYRYNGTGSLYSDVFDYRLCFFFLTPQKVHFKERKHILSIVNHFKI